MNPGGDVDLKRLRETAWIGDAIVSKPIRGVLLRFHGLGDNSLKEKADPLESLWARSGALIVYPYYGTWSWMNRESRAFVDDVVDSVYKIFRLGPRVPLISSGASMGGCAALLYTGAARRKVSACMALFPVTDLKAHFSERPDLPRTVHYAFRTYKEPYAKLFAEHSPLAQVKRMPRVPYLLIHGDADKAVSKERHSDPFAARMRALGHSLDYVVVPGMGHGGKTPRSVVRKQAEFVLKALG